MNIDINRPLDHLRRPILRTIYIDLDPSYVDHLRMINIRRMKIDINGPQDSPSEVGEGSIDMYFTEYSWLPIIYLNFVFYSV